MRAIYKRELSSYFHSMIGSICIAAMVFFVGIYFMVYNLINGYPSFSTALSSSLFLFLVVMPLLTMRSMSEERHSKTDQLLLTSPASVTGVVMGKFFAMLTIFAIPCVLKGYIILMMTLMVRVFSLRLMAEMGITAMLLLFGLLGMIFGSLSAMREFHIKRMLAYSSVAQIGYIFMGFGLGTIPGLMASCFHILVHACCKPLLFCCAGRLSAVSGHHRSLKNLRGSGYRDLTAGVGFTVGAMSMIGIPLFGGFVSKLYFANASLESSKMGMILLTIALSTVLNALYYVPAMLAIWEKPPREDEAAVLADASPEELSFNRPFATAAVILICGIFVLGIFYHPILDVIRQGIKLI